MSRGFKNKLGEGGYGSAYKGKLHSGHLVAIKMLEKSKANGQDFTMRVKEMLEGEVESLQMPPKPFLCPEENTANDKGVKSNSRC
ncbi:hypothetical protein FEM48_Zijuj05G0178100 [Ziziphus jujuba var. spinosa]|uniref:Protein kinase domain-containing protein n=1 Tax=Ziziphus jujuba var. spinosa TaxID=714518 RepID=A0A978VG90_ZIZJJ|nr:hypothetical protein FEM48_Zijuj05G0178100 [Ziziphus jujuba var. spinosa]